MEKKREFAVNYQIQYGHSCVYRQTINLTRKSFEKLENALLDQRVTNDNRSQDAIDGSEYYTALYLGTALSKIGCMVFFNHSQRDFFNARIKQYLRKPLLDRNTCICLID